MLYFLFALIDLGIHATMICKWQKQLYSEGERVFPGPGKPRDEEMAQLKKENNRLKQEVEILKKAVGIFTVRS